jgi:hypothetical protein
LIAAFFLRYWISIALVAAAFGGGWTVRDAFCDAAQTKALKKAVKNNQKEVSRVNRTAQKLEDYRNENDQFTGAARTEIRTIYRNREVRADCDLDPAARVVLDRAAAAANAAATGEPVVPVPHTVTDAGALR